jgi:Big-like domain-containing protein
MKNLRMVGLRSAALLLVAAQFSCGGGDSIAPPVATTLTANSTTSLSGTAGTAVTTPPSVLVRDQRGDPMSGVPVAFNVASGGGSVVGSAAVTNSSGVAAVTSWTLGTTVGTNTMVASTGSLTAVTFTAISVAGAPASITKTAGDAQSAPAGTAVAIPPSVTVKDANGNVVAGASVTFSVTAGGGSVTGGSQTTNSSGVATVGSWTLGPTAGANSLSATVGSTSAAFTATGMVGTAATVNKSAGDNQSAPAGSNVPVPPAVTVRDASGNPVSGVTVIFAVASGGGSLTGGSQVTNASGIATVGSWRLGAAAGTNTLTATAGSLPSVTFTATAVLSPLCEPANWPSHTLGTTTSGALTTDDCLRSSGIYMDFYKTTVSPAGAYAFDESSTAFDSFLFLYGPDGFVVGYNDDGNATSLDSHLKVLVPSAAYVLGATSYDPGSTGSYTLSSSTTSEAITGCPDVFVARGISTTQNLETTDCLFTGFYSDDMLIFLRAGTTVTVSMNSTALDARLQIYDRNGVVAQNDDKDSTTRDAYVVYTAPVNDFYVIVPTSSVTGATGAYTLIIQ